MKWNSIGASLVRLFRRPATSAPPKIELGAGDERSIAFLRAAGLMSPEAELKLRRTLPDWDGYRQAPRQASSEPATSQPQAGIKPPSDETDGQSWAWWLAQRGELIPGWAFCRFANKVGDTVALVYGHVRGSFGVWQQPYHMCRITEDGVDRSQTFLTTVTHLPSGHAIGIFEQREIAIEAAALADRVCDAWATETQSDRLGVAINRTREAWDGVGIIPCANAHAHDIEGDAVYIMGRSLESITHGKPERLS